MDKVASVLLVLFIIFCVTKNIFHSEDAGRSIPASVLSYMSQSKTSSDDKKDCLQKYVKKTQSDMAAKIISGACYRLFKDRGEFLREKVPEYNDIPIKDMLELTHRKYYGDLSEKDFYSLLEKKYEQEKEAAKCALELDDLYEAKNDTAANLIYANSECAKK